MPYEESDGSKWSKAGNCKPIANHVDERPVLCKE
jgi:hypothetical protein